MSIANLRYLPVSSGTVTLVAGAGTINDSEIVPASSLVSLSLNTVGGAVTVAPYLLTIAAGTCAVRAGGGDTSTYNWVVFNPQA